MIRGGGTLVLGQDQDSLGGTFSASQSFIGRMANVNIWDHVKYSVAMTLRSSLSSCLTGVGNVFRWRDFKDDRKGSVRRIDQLCLI